MMMTVEEARDVWCPMVRIARHEVLQIEGPTIGGLRSVHEEHHAVGGVNHDALGSSGAMKRLHPDHQPLASCRCIVDKCAMWRWGTKPDPDWKPPIPGTRYPPPPPKSVRAEVGYCGLAGRPGEPS